MLLRLTLIHRSLLAVAVSAVLGSAPLCVLAKVPLRVVATTGDTAPGSEGEDRTFLRFGYPNVFVLAEGQVVFSASVEDEDLPYGRTGLWREGAEGFEYMGLDGEPVPGLGGETFDAQAANGYGFQLYRDSEDVIGLHMGLSGNGIPADSPEEGNFMVWEPGQDPEPGEWRLVVRGNDTVGGKPMGFVPERMAFNAGVEAFVTSVPYSQVTPVSLLAVTGPERGTAAGILAGYDPLPGVEDYEVVGVEYAGEVQPAMNPAGDVAFVVLGDKMIGSLPHRLIYRSPAGGEPQILLDEKLYPDVDLTVDGIAINASGDVAFLGTHLGDAGIWVLGASGGSRPVALAGDAARGSPALFQSFQGMILRDDGTVAFIAETSQGVDGGFYSRQARGIWTEAMENNVPVLHKVAYEGDQAPGLPMEYHFAGYTGIGGLIGNASGDLAFTAQVVGNAPPDKNGLWVGDELGVELVMATFQFVEVAPGDQRYPLMINVRNSPFTTINPGPGIVNGPIADGRQGLMNENGVFGMEVIWGDETSSLVVVEPGLVVNSTGNDADLNPGDGVCDTGNMIGGVPECTLRAAMEEANALDGRDHIRFDIPVEDPNHAAGVWTITPGPGTLPPVSTSMVIDATTQPGYAGQPVVVLDGSTSRMVNDDPGFSVTGNRSEIRGFCIGRWGGQGFRIIGDDNIAAACWIGIGPDGVSLFGNDQDGVLLIDASGNVIGGVNPADHCVVANNGLGGGGGGSTGGQIVLQGPECTGNQVAGCTVGLDAAGMQTVPNPPSGVRLFQGQGNLVGPDNLIGGHSYGVEIDSGTENRVEGNWIGLNAAGDAPLPCTRAGVWLRQNSMDNVIGGIAAYPGENPGNLISGNARTGGAVPGILVDTGSHHNLIQGNSLGLDGQQQLFMPNSGDGIFLDGVDSTQVGDYNELGGNVIGKCGEAGIHVKGGVGTRLLANYVGNNRSRSLFNIPYNKPGILIEDSQDNRLQGGLVTRSSGAGIRIPTGDRHSIRGVATVDNSGLGIDLGAEGVDVGGGGEANQGQPYPELDRAMVDEVTGDVNVSGRLTAAPNTTYILEFFGNTVGKCDGSGFGEGEYLWSSHAVLTDAQGVAEFEVSLAPGIIGVPVARVTATATDAVGNTSELSNCIPIDAPVEGEWVLNSTGDLGDENPGDGNCDTGLMVGGEPECTLRAAIEESNALAGGQSVAFQIDGEALISPVGALPVLVGPLLVDGTTQPGYAQGDPSVTLDGSGAGDVDGLVLDGAGVTVRGLRIVNFAGDGIVVQGGSGHVLTGNVIGSESASGEGGEPAGAAEHATGGNGVAGGNGGSGIVLEAGDSTLVGGETPESGNLIVGNGGPAIRVAGGSGARLTGVESRGNGGLDFDLAGGDEDAYGVTANDLLDADSGPNGLQNYPVLETVDLLGDVLTVGGSLHSSAETAFTVQVYVGESCHESHHGGTPTFLGSVPVVTDAQGDAAFTADFSPFAVKTFSYDLAGAKVAATATGPEGTSEFSECSQIMVVPVLVRDFIAVREAADVRLSWEALPESDQQGFHILRVLDGTETQITSEYVSGGPLYAFVDSAAPATGAVEYVLVGISRNGEERRFGPVRVGQEAVERVGFRVLQNPVSDRALFYLTLPNPARVRVEVFSVTGRLVRTLVDEAFPRGSYPVEWRGLNAGGQPVASGAYLVRMVTAGQTRVARVVWLR